MCPSKLTTNSLRRCNSSTIAKNGPIKRRRVAFAKMHKSVRFNESSTVIDRRSEDDSRQKLSDTESPTAASTAPATTTWLSAAELSRIRNDAYRTLDLVVRLGAPSLYCSRGLEDYSAKRKGRATLSAIQRRRNAVRAVLEVQESQQGRRCSEKNSDNDDDSCRCDYCRHKNSFAANKIRKVYENQTRSNVGNGISVGRVDSEVALRIYAEDLQKRRLKRIGNEEHGRLLFVSNE